MQRKSGRGHELRLGSAADERDLGALSPQRVGHRERRHHVPGGPAGGDHDPPRRCAHGPIVPVRAPERRASAGSLRRHRAHVRGAARGDVEQQAHRGEHHDQAARAVGDERQRNARQRGEAEHGEHVEERLGEDQGGHADGDQAL